MQYPFEVTSKAQESPLILPESIQLQLKSEFEKEENRFVWDGKSFYWKDLEAGNLEIDFFSKKTLYRMQRINKAQEPLLRAIGWKNQQPQRIWDCTAGIGRDASLLFFAGNHVTMFERNPVLQILLSYAISQLPEKQYDQDFQLSPQDSVAFIEAFIANQKTLPPADCIYMDPMYPERKKSALVKKELRIIRNLVGSDLDSEKLLKLALQSGAPRIVVKRPKGAEYVAGRSPSHSIESPNTRYDVYLTAQIS